MGVGCLLAHINIARDGINGRLCYWCACHVASSDVSQNTSLWPLITMYTARVPALNQSDRLRQGPSVLRVFVPQNQSSREVRSVPFLADPRDLAAHKFPEAGGCQRRFVEPIWLIMAVDFHTTVVAPDAAGPFSLINVHTISF